MARPRKDPALKDLRGTLRKDREPKAAPAAIASAMVAPIPLTPRALTHFDAIVALLAKESRTSQHFAYAVALLAMRFDQIELLTDVIARFGHTVESRTTRKVGDEQVETVMTRARPEVAMLSDASRHAQSLMSELMLSPTAAQRLGKVEKPATNPFLDR